MNNKELLKQVLENYFLKANLGLYTKNDAITNLIGVVFNHAQGLQLIDFAVKSGHSLEDLFWKPVGMDLCDGEVPEEMLVTYKQPVEGHKASTLEEEYCLPEDIVEYKCSCSKCQDEPTIFPSVISPELSYNEQVSALTHGGSASGSYITLPTSKSTLSPSQLGIAIDNDGDLMEKKSPPVNVFEVYGVFSQRFGSCVAVGNTMEEAMDAIALISSDWHKDYPGDTLIIQRFPAVFAQPVTVLLEVKL